MRAIFLITVMLGTYARAAVIQLDAGDSTGISSLDSAYDVAAAGDTIHMETGIYSFYDIRIRKPLTLQGTAGLADSTVLSGHWLYCLADGITLRHLGLNMQRLLVEEGVSDVVIDSNAIRCHTIDCSAGSSIVVSNNRIFGRCDKYGYSLLCRNLTPDIHDNRFIGDTSCSIDNAIDISVDWACPLVTNPFRIRRNSFTDYGTGIRFTYYNIGPYDSSWTDYSRNWWGRNDTVNVVRNLMCSWLECDYRIYPILEQPPDSNGGMPGDTSAGMHYNAFMRIEKPLILLYAHVSIDDRTSANRMHCGQQRVYSLDGTFVGNTGLHRGIYLIYDGELVRKVMLHE